MKKLSIVLAVLLALGCTTGAFAADKPLKVFLLISGSLGDKGFNDSAKAGIDMMKVKLGDGVSVKYTELGTDAAKYAPALEDAGAEGYDVVICNNNFNNALADVAPRYPDTLYIMYDGWIAGNVANVYSVQYKNSEAGYLAGVLAATMTTLTKDPKINADPIIGFVGGRDLTGINDFLVGYVAGAQKVLPEVKVVSNFVNSFTDTAKGKDQALVQYGTYKADVIYHAAGRAGLGVFDAAVESGRYAIGVDTDQAALYANDPVKSGLILTSTLKRIDLTLFAAVQKVKAGTKLGGQKVFLGVADDVIGYAAFNKTIPAAVQKTLEAAVADVKAGKAKIPSAYTLSADEILKVRDSVNPAKK
jgi:basic membrane protein A